MDFLEILLGQIPEAIYFSLFMISTKEIKEKRWLFIGLMIFEYILLLNLLPYSTWSHVLYFILSYVIMKMLYKDKAQITDVFTLGIASVILIIISTLSYFFTIGVVPLFVIISRIIMFVFLHCFKQELPKINNVYKKLWNRGKHAYKMKSTTFRALNLVLFNISFYVINLGIIFHSLYWR